jgi:hypothetical protein
MTAYRPDLHRRRNRRPHDPFKGGGRSADNLGLAVVIVAASAFIGAIFAPGGPINDNSSSRSARPSDAFVYYSSCAEARAAGAAPIHKGDPGYRPGLDADGDGIACEPYQGM